MRTLLLALLCLLGNVLFAQHYSSFIKDLPTPARVVNDFGGFFTPTQKSTLEDSLISYKRRTGNAIVVITLSTLTDHKTGTTWSVEETALQYFSKWGIGDRNKNNGVLVLLSKEPRRVRITTGTGVDKILTDDECQRIINETIVPYFKQGKYYTGLKTGIHDIEAVLDAKIEPEAETPAANNLVAPAATQQQSQYASREPTLGEKIFFLFVFALTVWLRARYLRSKRVGAYDANSGATEPSNAITMSEYLSAFGWTFLWMLKIAFGVFILFYLLFRRRGGGRSYRSSYDDGYDDGYSRGRRSGSSFFSSNRSSSSSYSSGSSSGSSSASGSGSYGGGRSNGGGATGSW